MFGLRFADEFFVQVIYIGVIIDEILILHFFGLNANLYTIMLIIHVVSMYILGYKKDCWECSKKEGIYQIIYFVINISILILSFIITKTLVTFLVFFIPIILTLILSVLLIFVFNAVLCLLFKEDGRKMTIGMYALIMILFAIPILIIPMQIIYKTAIILIYYASIPLIACGTDNGMNFYTFFSNTYREYLEEEKYFKQNKDEPN